jgi:hypothetical protein
MTTYTITITCGEHSDIFFALRCHAAERRKLAEACGDIAVLAEQKASFEQEAKRIDDLASKINLAPFLTQNR